MDLVGPSISYRGLKLPAFTCVEHLQKLQSVEFGEKDVLLSSYPKSGSHWMFEIMNMLCEGSTAYTNKPLPNIETSNSFLETLSTDSPRILHSHLPCDVCPSNLIQCNQCVVVMRHPKDQLVSMYHMYTSFRGSKNRTFDSFFRRIMDHPEDVEYGDWFRNSLTWWYERVGNPNTLFVFYEDMQQDLRAEVSRVNEFLAFGRSAQFVDDVAEKTKFKQMKTKKPKLEWYSLCKEGYTIFRKGTVNGWKEYFSDQQSREFDQRFVTNWRQLSKTYGISKPPPYYEDFHADIIW